MRAAMPNEEGRVEVDGVEIAYEAFGEGPTAILLMPTSCIVHARAWKMQIPALARDHRVVTFDGPGNGGSSSPSEPALYTADAHVRYALAVLDATGIDHVTIICVSGGTHRSLRLAADHPERVDALVAMGPYTPFGEDADPAIFPFLFAGDWEGFVGAFMGAVFAEPHSTKAIEDGIDWGRGTTLGDVRHRPQRRLPQRPRRVRRHVRPHHVPRRRGARDGRPHHAGRARARPRGRDRRQRAARPVRGWWPPSGHP